MAEIFYVKAIWDPDAEVWCSESNMVGLVLETATLGEFESLARHFAPEPSRLIEAAMSKDFYPRLTALLHAAGWRRVTNAKGVTRNGARYHRSPFQEPAHSQ